jgi:hypothetical protein
LDFSVRLFLFLFLSGVLAYMNERQALRVLYIISLSIKRCVVVWALGRVIDIRDI